MTGPRRALAALAGSFAVYLTPLVGPHAAWLLGERLWREIARGGPGRGAPDPQWIATDVAVALAARLLWLALVFWFLGRPGWRRGLVLVAPIVPAVVALALPAQAHARRGGVRGPRSPRVQRPGRSRNPEGRMNAREHGRVAGQRVRARPGRKHPPSLPRLMG